MASRNRVKQYVAESFYHIYNRGVEKRDVFLDDKDYRVFLNLLKRYLDEKPAKDNKGREYEWLHERIELLAFCLMPNHFHLLVYQIDEKSMIRLMRGVCTSYTKYFNEKYERVGPLFQDRYKASLVNRDDYLLHISRYIHRNPKDYEQWDYSSYDYYMGRKHAGWLQNKRITSLFEGKDDYAQFVADYEDYKDSLDEIGSNLANT